MKNCSTPPRPRPAYWWCQVAGWGVYFLVNVFIARSFFTIGWRLISGYVFLSLLGILFTHGFRFFLLRRDWLALPVPKLLPRVLATNLLLAVALVFCVGIYFSFLPPGGPSYVGKTRAAQAPMFFVYVFNSFVIFTLWSGIYFGFDYFQQHRRLEIESYQARTALAEAELRGLKSQLNPHFLFNSLNSLRALVLEDPARAQEAITQLAAILRYHLQSGERSLVPLAEEIDTVEHYLALELIRFEDRLTIERAIDPASLPCLVPPLALQTLVENAVKYGVSREAGAGVIRLIASLSDRHPERSAAESKDPVERPSSVIASERPPAEQPSRSIPIDPLPENPRDPSTPPSAPLGMTARTLEICVRNTGSLHSSGGSRSTGLGLTNLRTRLRLLFGERATLDLHEPAPGWVEARLVLPVTAPASARAETGPAATDPSGGTSFRLAMVMEPKVTVLPERNETRLHP